MPAGCGVVASAMLFCCVADGVWKFALSPVESGGPFTVRVSVVGDAAHSLELKDVLFGDVWLCAGQNSMQQSLDQVRLPSTHCKILAWMLLRHYNTHKIL